MLRINTIEKTINRYCPGAIYIPSKCVSVPPKEEECFGTLQVTFGTLTYKGKTIKLDPLWTSDIDLSEKYYKQKYIAQYIAHYFRPIIKLGLENR